MAIILENEFNLLHNDSKCMLSVVELSERKLMSCHERRPETVCSTRRF